MKIYTYFAQQLLNPTPGSKCVYFDLFKSRGLITFVYLDTGYSINSVYGVHAEPKLETNAKFELLFLLVCHGKILFGFLPVLYDVYNRLKK
jgi:hypothetical protein